MNLKKSSLILILILLFLTGCSGDKISDAEFINTTPAKIKMDDSTYTLTDEILSEDEVKDQIGKINKITLIVSYLEEDNPYKNPRKIFEVKNVKIQDAIAIEVNDKFYKAKIEK